MKILPQLLSEAAEIVRYYRTGPLGDVPSVNGKLVEEALRKVMSDHGLGKITTTGLVDLGVAAWSAGIQVKTYRKKTKMIIFSRSDKKTKAARIQDMKDRAISSLKRSHATALYLLDVDSFTNNYDLYLLAKLNKNGTLRTFGSFLKDSAVKVNLSQTHFLVSKVGLKKVS